MSLILLLARSTSDLDAQETTFSPEALQVAPTPVAVPAQGNEDATKLNLAHLDGRVAVEAAGRAELPATWDWRAYEGGLPSPVQQQGTCGGCAFFAALTAIESRLWIDEAVPVDFSENNAKSCNWRELNDFPGWGSCDGGDFRMIVSLLAARGLAPEAEDPYTTEVVDCNTCVAYQKTLLDWRIISGQVVPEPYVLQHYLYTYGPIFTSLYADEAQGLNSDYDGTCTLDYAGPGNTNHAVVLVGWSDNLPPRCGSDSSEPVAGWIVRNSWGPNWGDGGYAYIAYGAADLGRNASYMHAWKDYDPNDTLLFYDEDGWTTNLGYDDMTAWGLVRFTPTTDTVATHIELWTNDTPTTVDAYLYDDFDGETLSTPLAMTLGQVFYEAGYHSLALEVPAALAAGDDVYVAVRYTNRTYARPIPADRNGPYESERTWISHSGNVWYDVGAQMHADVALRLRTRHPRGGAYELRSPQCAGDPGACALRDDGTQGDRAAGDAIHTLPLTVSDPTGDRATYTFFRVDGERTLPETPLTFDGAGPCALYLIPQDNPYGIETGTCAPYAAVTCDGDRADFAPVSFIGAGDFGGPSRRSAATGQPLDLRVEVYAAGLTDAGTASRGDAIEVALSYRQWQPGAQDWGPWLPYETAFAFEADTGERWSYLLQGLSLTDGGYELQATYTDWTGATGSTTPGSLLLQVGHGLLP